MRVQIKILFFCLLFYGIILPQNKVRIIDAKTLKPIENVLISAGTTAAYSDKNGYFSLSVFNKTDTLLFRHLLYKKLRITYLKLMERKSVRLFARDFLTKDVNIITQNNDVSRTSVKETIKIDDYKTAQYSGVGELLKKNTTLFIKDYGGYAGLKTISSRGMSSENTVILFNEARVNDLRTGTFNFAEVDSKFISKIIYEKNPAGIISSAGGVVKLFSGNENAGNSVTFGGMYNSYKTQNYYGSIKYSNNNISYSLNFNRIYSRNSYTYSFEGNNLKRENAEFSKSFVSGDIQWKTRNLIIKFYSHFSHLLNGLPGFVVTNNFNFSKASNLTNSLLTITNIDFAVNKYIFFSSNIGYHKQFLKLIDPLNQLLLDRKSQSSTFDDLGITNTIKFNYGNTETVLSYIFDYGQVDSLTADLQGEQFSNFTKRNEHLFSVGFNSNFKFRGLHKLVFSSRVSYQIINDHFMRQSKNNYLSYRAGFEIIPNIWKSSKFVFSFTDNYRHPSFNEVYYSGLFGNTNLRGEKYRELNAGINFKFNLFNKSEINFTYFTIWGSNKIIWVPTRLSFQVPYNIKKVKSEGFEFIIKQTIVKKIVNAEFIYSYVNARNRSFPSSTDYSYNKQLIYTPENRWDFNIYFNYKKFNVIINSSFVGKRFYTADNSEENSLAPYFLLDISGSYDFDILNINQIITLNAYNILNTNYFVIQSYPMPLNSYSINYQVRF